MKGLRNEIVTHLKTIDLGKPYLNLILYASIRPFFSPEQFQNIRIVTFLSPVMYITVVQVIFLNGAS